MIWTTIAVTFLATFVVGLLLTYLFLSAGQPIVERLSRLGRPTGVTTESQTEKRRERLERTLSDLGKLLPSSPKGLSRTQRMMIRAGYRRPELVMVMRGIQIVLPIFLVALIYLTGLYALNPLFLLGTAAVLGFLVPELWLTRRVRHRQHRILLALPDGVDLLVVCVEAGLGLDQSILRVAHELYITHPELSDELQLMNMEMRVGRSRVEALRELGTRTGVDDVKSLVGMLIQTDRFGTDLAQALRVHSDTLRTQRRQRAEEMAAKTSVKLIPPLVFFVFPALFVVLLGPAVLILVHQLLPSISK
ncbi:MAG: type II secretion system F family protein [Acidobacteria bacterium]|nr:type II secretion system F family protein [Acidobacteriota bacterium]